MSRCEVQPTGVNLVLFGELSRLIGATPAARPSIFNRISLKGVSDKHAQKDTRRRTTYRLCVL